MSTIAQDLLYLAGKEAEGRLSGTQGATNAARYLANQLRANGYRPPFADSYFQPVEVPAARLTVCFACGHP